MCTSSNTNDADGASAADSGKPTSLAQFGTAAPSDKDLQDIQQSLLSAVNSVRTNGTATQNQMLDYLLNQAHDQTAALVKGDTNSSPIHNILANVKSLLMHAQLMPTTTGGVALSSISDEGDLVGKNRYETLDVRWTESAVNWIEHLTSQAKAPFRTKPPTIAMDGGVSLTIAGDWGTGFDYRTDGASTPAEKVADEMKRLNPSHTVHLGDVYYSGTGQEELEKFIGKWPAGGKGSFTLNSNHEMYSGAKGYYGVLDGASDFAAQESNGGFNRSMQHLWSNSGRKG